MFNGEIQPEVIIYNSYDGTKALEIHIAFTRFVCANGLIAGTHEIEPLKIHHTTIDWQDKVHEYIDTYGTKIEKQKEIYSAMKEIPMSLDEAYAYAEKAIELRHSDDRISMDVVDPLELLVAKRKEDRGNKVWNRFQTVQEATINGLFHKYGNDGSIKKAKMLTDINEIVRVNKELSNLFEKRVA